MHGLSTRFLILLLIGLWFSSVALAEISLGDQTFSLRGFGTLGGPYNFDGQAGFIRNNSQPDGARGDGVGWDIDSRLGLQLDWKPREDFSGALQLVSRYRYDGSFTPDVTLAFLKYAFDPDLEMRVGRIGIDFNFQADSRDAGYTYLWVRPPVEYFGQSFMSHGDGFDLTATHGLGEGILQGKLYAAQASETVPTAAGNEYELDGSALVGGYLQYQRLNWQFRIGYRVFQLENETPADPLLTLVQDTGVPDAIAFAQKARIAGKRFNLFDIGVAYDQGPLQSQLFIKRFSSESITFPDYISGFWSVGYRIGSWTPYLVYSRIKSEQDSYATGLPDIPPFDALNARVIQALSPYQFDQQTFSLGVRHDFARNADFKLQLDFIRNDRLPSALWTDSDPDWDGRATVLSATLDFVF